jgi:hypothetical protein
MNWIDVAQDRDQWSALVDTVINHKLLGCSLVAAQLAASQEGLSSMKLVNNNCISHSSAGLEIYKE